MEELTQIERLQIKLLVSLENYTEWIFKFGETSAIAMCKKHQIEGFIEGLVFSGIITEKQNRGIIKEMQIIRDEYWKMFPDIKSQERNIEAEKKILEQVQKNIEIILSESKEESR